VINILNNPSGPIPTYVRPSGRGSGIPGYIGFNS
jgi:hypothetical protein